MPRTPLQSVLDPAMHLIGSLPKRAWDATQDGVDAVSTSMKGLLTLPEKHAPFQQTPQIDDQMARASPKLQKRSHRLEHCPSSHVLEMLANAKLDPSHDSSEVHALFDLKPFAIDVFDTFERGPASPARSFDENAEAPKSPASSRSRASSDEAPSTTDAPPKSLKHKFYGSPPIAEKKAKSSMLATTWSEWGDAEFDVGAAANMAPLASAWSQRGVALHSIDEF